MKTYITSLLILSTCLITISSSLTGQCDKLDQEQSTNNYGFWFEDNIIRWQEFIPSFYSLSTVQLFINREGDGGNMIVEIRDLESRVLAQTIVSQAAVPDFDWLSVSFVPGVQLTPGEKYRIYVYTDTDSPDANNRYFWRGNTSSLYNPDCETDVSSGWPGYDYAFRTLGHQLRIDESIGNVLCFGDSNGTIEITVSEGYSPYSYSWIDETGTGSVTGQKDQSGLTAGTFSLIVVDNLGCSSKEIFTILEPDELIVEIFEVAIETCTGCSDGSISISVTGGILPYNIAWTGPNGFTSTNEIISNLEVGEYSVSVTDDNGCNATASAEVFNPLMVTNTDDSGMGSLRNAIVYANSHLGRDSILFNIPVPGPYTILPLSPLPPIIDPLIIDGYTQTGAEKATATTFANLKIELDGFNLIDDHYTSGLTINGSGGNCVIRGLMINRFGDDGIHIDGPGGNIIEGNFIGVDHTGLQAKGNYDGALRIWNSPNNTIGGLLPEQRNVMASDRSHVVQILLALAENNVILGNYLGVATDGETQIGTTEVGVRISEAAHHNTIGPNNVISGHNLSGIEIVVQNPHHNKIIGNYIGTVHDGSGPLGNGDGIRIIGASYTTIGGTTEESRNLISGNAGIGLVIEGDTGTIVIGNYIGTDIEGVNALPNGGGGIWMGQGSSYNTVGGSTSSERNVISGNGIDNLSHGLVISDAGSTGNKVTGNYIGLDATGQNSVGNGGDGLQIRDGASGNIVGGITRGESNVISGNGVTGIAIYGDADENIIQGNLIGLDASGVKNIGHPHGTGVYIGSGSSNNIVGGGISGAGNFIAGNTGWAGVALDSPGTDENLVMGNYIGFDLSGDAEFGNLVGIRIYNGASNNKVGGMEYWERNYISHSEEAGIVIYNDEDNMDETSGNQLLSNVIHSNGTLGIDLGYDGVTENDEGDVDGSPNNLQNFPVLDSISFSPGAVTVGGWLNSAPGADFILQFFANRVVDHSTHGEGETFLGSDTTATDGSGNATFLHTYPIYSLSGQVITATATDMEGNTSEFSLALGGVRDQILADINRPFHYSIHEDGVPNITDGSDTAAINAAFKAWMDIPTADLEFTLDGMTSIMNASATDGVNLLTFRDEKFPIPPGVLAIAAKTLRLRPGDLEAEILDADIVFNPDYVNKEDLEFGIWQQQEDTAKIFDVQSVTTHEIGHLLGLIHTGVPSSTMFFALGTDTLNRSLEPDDMAWASYRYPNSLFNTSYGYLSGHISYGDIEDNIGNHPPVAGALVLAVDTTTKEMFHAYTDAYGNYLVPVPAKISDTTFYWILIQPLDGDVFTFNLRPGNISSYVYSNTIYTEYPVEWYDEEESADDDPLNGVEIGVLAQQVIDTINLITNRDLTPPTVVSVIPIMGTDSVPIRPDIRIKFSEPVDKGSFTDTTCYLTLEQDTVGGGYKYFKDSTHIILFRPDESLYYDSVYTLHVLGITDTKDNRMDDEYTSWFTTMPPDLVPPEVIGTIPEDEQDSVFVTESIMVFFSKPMDKKLLFDGFTLSHDGDPDVNGSYDLDPHNKALTFKPLTSLKEAEEYTVTLPASIKDLAGNTLNEHIYTFKTVLEAAPEVLYLGPLDTEDSITVETPVVVDFTEPIDRSTISQETFSLYSNNVAVPGAFEYLENDSRIIFRPDLYLDFGQLYTVHLEGGEFGIYDLSEPDSLSLELPGITTTFTTAPVPIQPYLEYLYPISGVPGSVVTIIGGGFDPNPENNKVLFSGSEAVVRSATLHSLTTEVPNGAITGGVSVIVKGKESYNSRFFYVIPESLDPCAFEEANIQSGSSSRSVAISPDAAFAYVTNYDAGFVSVIDLVNEKLLEEPIYVENSPLMIDMNPEGTRAYVTNHMSHTVSVIDTDSFSINFNKQIKVIDVGVGPYGVAAAADGMVYVANHYSKNISVIDANPASGGFNRAISNINTGTANRSIAVSPDAGLALVTGDDGLNIITFTPGGDYSDALITNVNSGTKTRDVAIRPDAGFAIVTTEEGNLFIVDIYPGDNFGAIIANVNSGSRARDVSISPDALFVYITMINPDEVAVFSFDYGGIGVPSGSYFSNISLKLHHTIPLEGAPKALAIDPKAEKLVVVQGTSDVNLDKLKPVRICCGPVTPEKLIGDMIINIQNLVRSGIVSHGHGDALISILYDALLNLNEDDIKGTLNVLNTFIKKVTLMIKKNQISVEQGQALIDQANAIIRELEAGTNSADMVMGIGDFEVPDESALGPIYPNPFKHSTTVHYAISAEGTSPVHVRLRIYNSTGQVVANLVDQKMTPGHYTVEWNGRSEDDRMVSDGIYFVRLTEGQVQLVEKAVVIR